MFKEIVTVEEVLESKVRIRFEKKKSCSCCQINSVCGQGQNTLLIDNPSLSLNPKDKVEVAIDEKMTVLASLLTFLVPAVVFMASLIIFKPRGELTSFFLAIGLVCIYYIVLKLILRKKDKKFKLKILGKV